MKASTIFASRRDINSFKGMDTSYLIVGCNHGNKYKPVSMDIKNCSLTSSLQVRK